MIRTLTIFRQVEAVQHATIEDFDAILVKHRKDPILKITTPYHGLPGKGSAFRTIFEIAHSLKAKACIVVDSDLRSITPEWVELLVTPIFVKDYDFVAPLYLRHKYDGTITNSIIYPLTRALYGKRVRQPIGGDFGFSGCGKIRHRHLDDHDRHGQRFQDMPIFSGCKNS